MIWVSALMQSDDGVTTSSGARFGIIVMVGIYMVAVMFRGAEIWAPDPLTYFPIIGTGLFLSAAGLLFGIGRLDWAYVLYGGFHVLRSDKLFSDMDWVLNWFECDFCSRWDPYYGPTLQWLEPFSFGTIGTNWLLVASLALAIAGIVSLVTLGRLSSPIGRWLIAAASISPAWLLLVDRANSDLIVFVFCIVGLGLVHRYPKFSVWLIFAIVLWYLGTVKFYPFAIGLVLLFALTIRRGWLIVASYGVATLLYMIIARDAYIESSRWTVRDDLFVGDFPYYSRTFIADRISSGVDSSLIDAFVFIGLTALVALSAYLGWSLCNPSSIGRRSALLGALALAGGAAFTGKVLWAGFGFMYTGAFLLLIVPALGVFGSKVGPKYGLALGVALFGFVALFTAYNTALATISGLVLGGFGLGFGARVLVTEIRSQRKPNAMQVH